MLVPICLMLLVAGALGESTQDEDVRYIPEGETIPEGYEIVDIWYIQDEGTDLFLSQPESDYDSDLLNNGLAPLDDQENEMGNVEEEDSLSREKRSPFFGKFRRGRRRHRGGYRRRNRYYRKKRPVIKVYVVKKGYGGYGGHGGYRKYGKYGK